MKSITRQSSLKKGVRYEKTKKHKRTRKTAAVYRMLSLMIVRMSFVVKCP